MVHGGAYPRTGIPRVAETLAKALVATGRCDLTFTAAENEDLHYWAVDYRAADAELATIPFPYSRWHKNLHDRMCVLTGRIDNSTGCRRITQRAMRKGCYFVERATKGRHDVLPDGLLQSADIFHSTYLQIPSRAMQQRSLIKFLTVYDLIPLLHPEFFGNKLNHPLKSTLHALTPESWVLCISEATKIDLLNTITSVSPDHVCVVRLGAEPSFRPSHDASARQAIRRRLGIGDAPYFLGLFLLEPRKNTSHLIRCFAQLIHSRHLKDTKLVLAGPYGVDYQNIRQTAHEANLRSDQVIFPGYIPSEDLPALYSGAIAFVYPSFYEGFGLPVLEAMKCGTPVITSNTSSLPEVVGDAGIQVSPTNADELCAAMLNLYQNSSTRQLLAQKGLARAAIFSWERCAEDTISAYTRALSSTT